MNHSETEFEQPRITGTDFKNIKEISLTLKKPSKNCTFLF